MIRPIQQLSDKPHLIRGFFLSFEAQRDRFEWAEQPDYKIFDGKIAQTLCG